MSLIENLLTILQLSSFFKINEHSVTYQVLTNHVVIGRNTTSFAHSDEKDDSTKLATFIKHHVLCCPLMVMKPLKPFKNVSQSFMSRSHLLFQARLFHVPKRMGKDRKSVLELLVLLHFLTPFLESPNFFHYLILCKDIR